MSLDFGAHTFFIGLSYGATAALFLTYIALRFQKRSAIKKAVKHQLLQEQINNSSLGKSQ